MTEKRIPSFNLLDEDWIPVQSISGDVAEVSLTSALLDAANYHAISETSPPNLIALYRLLLAVLHRALTLHHGPWKDSDRARWYREGLPAQAITAYLQQWRDRFWLFHPECPFMQVAALNDAPETAGKLKPWTQIALDSATGNTALVFDHATDDLPAAISPRTACRLLLGVLQFIPGGLVKALRGSDKAGALANTAAVLPIGTNLSQTLMLGLHRPSARGIADLPSWERPAPTITELKGAPTLATGPNDRYTRLSRAILLLPESKSENVQHIRFAVGRALEEDVSAPDPMAGYRINKQAKPIRVTFAEGRSIWRELPAFVPDPSGKLNTPPAILEGATNLYGRIGLWDMPIRILVAGVASDQAKLVRWRAERIELPLKLLANPDAATELRRHMRSADDIYFRLKGICAGMIAASMPDPGHKDTKAKARAILEKGPSAAVFYSSTERALPQLMQRIAHGNGDATHRYWMGIEKIAALDAWDATCRILGNSPKALRAEARTYPRFRGLLRTLEPIEQEDNKSEVNE